jgi:uncharacterized RDD family membrane protein YckC
VADLRRAAYRLAARRNPNDNSVMFSERQTDTRINIVTPENIAFQHRVAGPFQRIPAYFIDLALRLTFVFAVAMIVLCSGAGFVLGAGPILIFAFVVEWFYGGLFEALWNGRTPGKRLLRLRVVCTNGQPIDGMQAVLRNVLRAVDMLPTVFTIPTFQLGLLAMMMNRRHQRLGDIVCGTMVVVEEPQRLYGVARVSEPEAIRLAAEIPPSFRPTRSLALALSNYVQRRQGFPWPRRAEIARHLAEPLRERLGLPRGTSADMLLCAVYHRTFIEDRPETDAGASPFVTAPQAQVPATQNPFTLPAGMSR